MEGLMKKWLKSALALAVGGTSLLWSGMVQAVEIEYWQYTYAKPSGSYR